MAKYPAPGQLVEVNDTQMHVFTVPDGPAESPVTLVFLAGSGTGCPAYDFKPLWHALQGRYNMVVVERPGYGWSGLTKRPRDIDTLLEETRAALKGAGIKGPFVPVAHSLAGLEAIYWAQQYPAEVAGMIGLDMAVPPVYDGMELPPMFGFQVAVARLFSGRVAKTTVKGHPAAKSGLLSEAEQAAMRQVVKKRTLTRNMVDESGYVKANARKVAGGERPAAPLLCFLGKGMEKTIPIWGKAHRELFEEDGRTRFVDLDCGHYVHREEPERIASEIERWFPLL